MFLLKYRGKGQQHKENHEVLVMYLACPLGKLQDQGPGFKDTQPAAQQLPFLYSIFEFPSLGLKFYLFPLHPDEIISFYHPAPQFLWKRGVRLIKERGREG